MQELVAKRRFRAMNTDVEVTLADWTRGALLDDVVAYVEAFEARFSRFRAESELCRLNDRAGEPTPVSHEMLEILDAAMRMHTTTGGLFDPAVLPVLEAHGYDRSFEFVEDGEAAVKVPDSGHMFADVAIDREHSVVRLPAGMRIDLGGIGKGYCVDRVVEMLRDAGPALVNAGGDMFALGGGLDGNGWRVGILDPEHAGCRLGEVTLRDSAMATSTTAKRRWIRGGATQHHIIDPRTARPATTGVISATVAASDATNADVFAKTALMLGVDEGTRFLEDNGAGGLFVLTGGLRQTTRDWVDTDWR
jgi:thiamine biosynthesis lipoprotein